MLDAIRDLARVLVISRVGNAFAWAFCPSSTVFSERLVVLPFDTFGAFCLVQCRSHDVWSRFFGSSLKDDLMYAPSDCFETFPFPPDWETHVGIEAAGRGYYDFRATLMVRNNEGLTKTYNRFHDPDEADPEILKLRDLHAAMDRAVLDACGWTDIPTDCEFLLDWEDEDDDADGATPARRRKKPWRLRWPDPVRDEVLARLLALNAERADAEARVGAVAAEAVRSKRRGKPRPPGPDLLDGLF